MVRIEKSAMCVKFFDQASFFISDNFNWPDFSLGGNREGEIPDPIPNSEVKPFLADGTVRKSMEE